MLFITLHHAWFLLRKDLRYCLPALVVWLLFLATPALLSLGYFAPDSTATALQYILGWSAGVLGLLFGLALMREDRLWGKTATVQLRPLSGTSLFLAKALLLAAVFILVPLLVLIPFWFHAGLGARSLFIALRGFAWLGLCFVAATLFLVHGQETQGGAFSRFLRLVGYLLLLALSCVVHLWLRFHWVEADLCAGSPAADIRSSIHCLPWLLLLATWLTYVFRRPLLSVCSVGALTMLLGPLMQWRAHALLEGMIEAAPAEVKAIEINTSKAPFVRDGVLFGVVRIPFQLGVLSGRQTIRWGNLTPNRSYRWDCRVRYGLFPDISSSSLPLQAALESESPEYYSYPPFADLLDQSYAQKNGWYFCRMSQEELHDPRYDWHVFRNFSPQIIPPDQSADLSYSPFHGQCLIVKEEVRVIAKVPLQAGETLDSQEGYAAKIKACSLDLDGLHLLVRITDVRSQAEEEPLFILNEQKKVFLPLSNRGKVPFVFGHTQQWVTEYHFSAADLGLASLASHPAERDAQLQGFKLVYISRAILGFTRLNFSIPGGVIHVPALSPEQMQQRAESLRKREEWIQLKEKHQRKLDAQRP